MSESVEMGQTHQEHEGEEAKKISEKSNRCEVKSLNHKITANFSGLLNKATSSIMNQSYLLTLCTL